MWHDYVYLIANLRVLNDWTLKFLNQFSTEATLVDWRAVRSLSALPLNPDFSDFQSHVHTLSTAPVTSTKPSKCYDGIPASLPLNLPSQWLQDLPTLTPLQFTGTKPNSRASPSSHRASLPPSVLSPPHKPFYSILYHYYYKLQSIL